MTLLDDLWASVGGGTMPKPKDDGTAHLDSKLLDVASEGWNGERPDGFLFSDFGTFTQHLHDDDPSDVRRRLADARITLLMSDMTVRLGTHTVVFQDDGGQGGLYVRIDVSPETVDVAFVSNYAQLEIKETWYQAVLSLYEWYAFPTGTFNVNVYRKSWPRTQATLNIATQLSEIIVFIFDVMRSGTFRLLVSNLDQFPRLAAEMAQLVVWPIETDFTFAERAVRLTREVGMIPAPTTNTVHQELTLGTTNVSKAYEIAAMNDDEIGTTSLSELTRLLRMRGRYVSDMRDVLMDILYNQDFEQDADDDDVWDEDEDDENDEFEPEEFNAEWLIQKLIDSRFLSVAGHRFEGANRLSEAQGMRDGSSPQTGDDMGLYLVDAGLVEAKDGSWPASLDETIARGLELADDEDYHVLGCYAWPGVLVWLSQGRPDGDIPADIVERLGDELKDFSPTLAWKRQVPKARTFVSRYPVVRGIVGDLINGAGLKILHTLGHRDMLERGAGEYMAELGIRPDPTFTMMDAQLNIFGATSPPVRIDIICNNRWAQEGPHLLDAMIPEAHSHLFVSDDGWTVRIVDEHSSLVPFALRRLALAVAASVGGKVRTSGAFSPLELDL